MMQQQSLDDAGVVASFRNAFNAIYNNNNVVDGLDAAGADMGREDAAHGVNCDDDADDGRLAAPAAVVATVSTILGPLPVYDFVQWTSSFTMAQIPTHEMLEWVRCCVDRIVQHTSKQQCGSCHRWTMRRDDAAVGCCCPVGHPQQRRHRVLDIGCGTGLVLMEWMLRLAQDAAKQRQLSTDDDTDGRPPRFADAFWYTGVELSSNCVQTLRERLSKYVPQVEGSVHLFCAAGHEVAFDDPSWWAPPPPPGTPPPSYSLPLRGLFDSAIINSVVMYLPSLQYLEHVLATTAAHLAPGGCIFIGDVRDSRLLRLFYLSIALYRNGLDMHLEALAEVLAAFDQSVANDPHLLVSPMDFVRMGHRLGATSVLMQPKLSTHSYAKAFSSVVVEHDATLSDTDDLAAETEALWGAGGTVWASCLDNEMTRYRFDVTMQFGVPAQGDSGHTNNNDDVCTVSIPVDGVHGNSAGAVLAVLPTFPWREALNAEGDRRQNAERGDINPAPQTPQDRHRHRLTSFVQSGVAAASSAGGTTLPPASWAFAYPHVPVLFDALIGESRVDRGGGGSQSSSMDRRVQLAIRVAKSLLTPRELVAWFDALSIENEEDDVDSSVGSLRRWKLELTVHPCDPTLLICILYPAGCAVLQVVYPLSGVDTKGDSNVRTATSNCSAPSSLSPQHLRLCSSQPRTNPRQAHFFNQLDMLDQWQAAVDRAFNDTHVVFPVPLVPIGAMLWMSFAEMISMAVTPGTEENGATTSSPEAYRFTMPVCVRQSTSGTLDADASAIGGGENEASLTWLELAEHVDALAKVMTTVYHVAPGDFVIQFVDRSLDQIVGMLAIFTVGAVFVPLAASPNPDPPARIAKVLADCTPTLLLTQPHLKAHLEEALRVAHASSSDSGRGGGDAAASAASRHLTPPIVCAAWHRPTVPTANSRADITDWCLRREAACRLMPVDGAAYCIYTSGSTSLPKAVVITHRNFQNLLCAFHFGNASNNNNIKDKNTPMDGQEGSWGHPSITTTRTQPMHTLQTTATSFDLHVYECLSPLLAPFLLQGNGIEEDASGVVVDTRRMPELQLVLLPPGNIDLQTYVDTMEACAVTHVVCTPTLLSAIAEHCDLHGCWASLRHVRVWRTGGEALKQKLVDAVLPVLRSHNPSVAMWCSYGPAECTDTATMSACDLSSRSPLAASTALVSLGRPLANYGAHVLVECNDGDIDGESVPNDAASRKVRLARVGEVGMIYLSGPSVFNGYLKRPDITANVLLRLSDGDSKQETILYRTGDLGRMATHATTTVVARAPLCHHLFYMGRVDFAQVKLRGQRIETTEIESVLMAHPDVAHVIVVKYTPPQEGGEAAPSQPTTGSADANDEFLVAYYALDHRRKSTVDQVVVGDALRTLAVQSFPAFMVPSMFQHVDEFKTNRNGKVDRKLLPPPSSTTSTLPSPPMPSSHTVPVASAGGGEDCPLPLCWLRQQMLQLWLELNMSVAASDPLLLLVTTPSFTEPVFCSSWMEMGASSLVLMRYISRLKHFFEQWYRHHGGDDWSLPSVGQKRGNESSGGPSTGARGGGLAVVASSPTPAAPTLTLASRKALQHLLTFPQMYKHRSINGVSLALFRILFPSDTTTAPSNSACRPPTLSLAGGAVAAAADGCGAGHVLGSEEEEEAHPGGAAPTWGYRLRWGTLLQLVWIKNRAAQMWTSMRQRLQRMRGVPLSTEAAALAGTIRRPCCTQQSIMVIDELHRQGDAPDRNGVKNFYNCPYTMRVNPRGAAKWTLGDGKRAAAQLEAILTIIVRRHPSLRMILTWEGDRAAQHEYQLEGCHADACKFTQHTTYTEAAESSNNATRRAREDYFAFSGTEPTSALAQAIHAAANEPLAKACHRRLFHFHVFYDLPAAAAAVAANTTGANDGGDADETTPLVSMHVMLNFHHAIFDGESIHQLLRQIDALARTTPLPLQAPQSTAYLTYCKWVDDGKPWTEQANCIQYWLRHMEQWQTAVAITRCLPRTCTAVDGVWASNNNSNDIAVNQADAGAVFTAKSAKVRQFVPQAMATQLFKYCAAHDVTPYSFFLTCYYMTLSEYRHSKSEGSSGGSGGNPCAPEDEVADVCVGSAISNRGGHVSDELDALASSLCLLADTYPFRLRIRPNTDTVGALLIRVQRMVAAHMAHAATALGVIFVALMIEQPSVSVVPPRHPIKNPFFGAVLLYEDRQFCQVIRDVPLGEELGNDGGGVSSVDLELLDLPDFGAIFEIQLKISELEPDSTPCGAPLALTWEYATELYSAEAISSLSLRYWDVVTAVLGLGHGASDDGDRRRVSDILRCDASKRV